MGIPGSVKKFDKRSGGYLNYQYNSETPEKNNPDFMLEEDKANQMLKEANDFIQKYFPWMKDFVVFQLCDGTIRLDAANREFLGEE
ncbi:MAG: hypothetical protein UFJ18_06820 [Blautia sp.]|nr:hypothetical protein [Blautia sp.]